jgi:hypothetical protein
MSGNRPDFGEINLEGFAGVFESAKEEASGVGDSTTELSETQLPLEEDGDRLDGVHMLPDLFFPMRARRWRIIRSQ